MKNIKLYDIGVVIDDYDSYNMGLMSYKKAIKLYEGIRDKTVAIQFENTLAVWLMEVEHDETVIDSFVLKKNKK